MAIEVGDKIYRNLPEQVEWLSNQFVRILEAFEELGTVMRYKGSVATYADLPADNNKVGDVYNVIDTGSNYAWDGEGWDEIGSTVDLSNLVTLDTAQDITGQKTSKVMQLYEDGIAVLNNDASYNYKIYNDASSNFIIARTTDLENFTTLFYMTNGGTVYAREILPAANNNYDLGTSSRKWKDLYLSGNISDGTNSLSVADVSDGVIKFFDAPSSGVPDGLTSALKNGKICYVNGNVSNPALIYKYGAMLFPTKGSTGAWGIGYYFDQANHEKMTVFQYRDGGTSSYNWINLKNILSINGKELPNYPTTNIVPQVLTIGANGGNLSWEDSKPTTVTVGVNDTITSADLSSYSGKIIVLEALGTAGSTWTTVFTLPSTIIAAGLMKSYSSETIDITGFSLINHTITITNLDNLDAGSYCLIDLSDGITAKVIVGRAF